MNDSRQPNESAPTSPGAQPKSAQTRDPDDAEFAAFLEEQHAPAPPPAPPAATRSAAAPPPAAPAAPPKPVIRFNMAEGQRKQHNWKRQTAVSGTGVCRVKSFRGKYTDAGIEHLDDTINEWLDSHPDVEVKFVTSTVSAFEGKAHEPVLVLNLWY